MAWQKKTIKKSWKDIYAEQLGTAVPKQHKYSAEKTTRNGHRYDSKAESIVSAQLQLEERGGGISCLSYQVEVSLSEAKIIYKPDFKFVRPFLHPKTSHCTIPEGQFFSYAECKGFETPEWRIKRRLWIAYGPGPLEVYNVINGHVVLKEVLLPPDFRALPYPRGVKCITHV